MNARQHRGLSLLELMVTLLVGGIVLGVGVPNFMEFRDNNAMITQANDLVTGIHLARAEAVKRQQPVTVCMSANPQDIVPACGPGPEVGYIVFVDDINPLVIAGTDGNAVFDDGETLLMQHASPGGTIDFVGDSDYLSFAGDGFVVPQATGQGLPSATTLLFCDRRGNSDTGGRSSARVVTISPTGRPQIMQNQIDVANAAATTGAICPYP
ncbi:MAG: GspH/FimT family pseudopilin [Gammaproteobacteria bacterium]